MAGNHLNALNLKRKVVKGTILFCCFAFVVQVQAQNNLRKLRKQAGSTIASITVYDSANNIVNQGNGLFTAPNYIISSRFLFEGVDHVEVRTQDGKIYPITGIVPIFGGIGLNSSPICLFLDTANTTQNFFAGSQSSEGQKIYVVSGLPNEKMKISEAIVSSIHDTPIGRIVKITGTELSGLAGSPVISQAGLKIIGFLPTDIKKGQKQATIIHVENISARNFPPPKMMVGKTVSFTYWKENSSPKDSTGYEFSFLSGLRPYTHKITRTQYRFLEKPSKNIPEMIWPDTLLPIAKMNSTTQKKRKKHARKLRTFQR